MPNSPYLSRPARTMWEAARDLFDQAFRFGDPEMWGRAYRLWMLAKAMNAPGQPFELDNYRANQQQPPQAAANPSWAA